MIVLTVFLALAQSSPPPCPQGKSECDPWERYNPQPNPFDQFIPKSHKLGPSPHTLIIGSGPGAVQREYKSGAACQHARDEVLAQVDRQLPSGAYVHSTVMVLCVPR